MYEQTEIEKERKRRINVSLWAYAYEIENDSIVSDQEFDEVCCNIDISIETGNEKMDKFFREKFDKDTGMWIHSHPGLNGIRCLYGRYFEL